MKHNLCILFSCDHVPCLWYPVLQQRAEDIWYCSTECLGSCTANVAYCFWNTYLWRLVKAYCCCRCCCFCMNIFNIHINNNKIPQNIFLCVSVKPWPSWDYKALYFEGKSIEMEQFFFFLHFVGYVVCAYAVWIFSIKVCYMYLYPLDISKITPINEFLRKIFSYLT